MIYTPRVYQGLIQDFGANHARCNIWAGMGLGKTAASLSLAQYLRVFGEARRVLVLGPKRVCKISWPDEIAKWRESYGDLDYAVCVGTPDERRAALKRNTFLVFANYDILPWLCEGYGDNWPFDMVIADESPHLKGLRVAVLESSKGNQFTRGQGSKRAYAIHRIAMKHVRRWINLTGSPAPNGVIDLWGQQFFVDFGQRLGTSFTAFENRYFRSVPNADGYHQLEPLQYAQPQIEALLKDCTISINAKDYFDIKDPIESNIMIDLPPKAQAAYLTMQKKLFAEINEHRIDVFAAGAKSMKLLQMCSGSVWIDREEQHWEPLHDEKLDALASVFEEANGEPVLVRYCHRPDIERITKRFKFVKFFDDNPQTLKDWNEGKIKALLTHAKSAGHGLSMQYGGRILCDYSSDFNLEQDEQIIERIGPTRQMQAGLDRAVFRRRIIARNTIEEHSVLPRLKLKMSVQDALKNAMKVMGT